MQTCPSPLHPNILFQEIQEQLSPDKSFLSSQKKYLSSTPPKPTRESKLQNENSSDEEVSCEEFNGSGSTLTCSDLETEIEKEKAKWNTTRPKKPLPQSFEDISLSDMDFPDRARSCLNITKKTLSEIQMKYRKLQHRNYRLNNAVNWWKSFFIYLEGNDFLNEHARAVVRAVLSRDTEPP